MKSLWNKLWVRRVAASVIFLLAAALQVFFKNIPWPLDVAATDALKAPKATLASTELVLTNAVVMPKHAFLSYDGNPWEVADIDFDSAQIELDPGIAALLASSNDGAPPAAPRPWHYVTYDKPGTPAGETCRTFVQLNVQQPDAPPGEFHIFQLGDPGLNHLRRVEMKSDSSNLVVDAKTVPSDATKPNAPGCWKTLESGNWQTHVRSVPVRFVTTPKAAFRITYVSQSPNRPSWGRDSFKSAYLGPLLAHSVTLRQIQEDGDPAKAPPSLELVGFRSSNLTVKNLELGSQDLKVAVTGTAFAQVNGKTFGFDLIDALQKNMVIAAVLTAANGALLAWLSNLFFKSPRKRSKRRKLAAG